MSFQRAETVRNAPAQPISRIAGRPNAKLMMAPMTASPAAIGMIRLAVYVHAPSITEAVPKRVPSFQP